MLNKNWTDPKILASKVDPSAAKKYLNFLQSFHFEGLYRRSWRQQEILCRDFLLVGVLTVQKKPWHHDLEQSLLGLMSTLLPTVRLDTEKVIENFFLSNSFIFLLFGHSTKQNWFFYGNWILWWIFFVILISHLAFLSKLSRTDVAKRINGKVCCSIFGKLWS